MARTKESGIRFTYTTRKCSRISAIAPKSNFEKCTRLMRAFADRETKRFIHLQRSNNISPSHHPGAIWEPTLQDSLQPFEWVATFLFMWICNSSTPFVAERRIWGGEEEAWIMAPPPFQESFTIPIDSLGFLCFAEIASQFATFFRVAG